MRDTLSNQLSKAFNRDIEKKNYNNEPKRQKPKSNLPHAADWVGDGEDHINLFYGGVTDLGRTLHPNSILEFEHPLFGRFNSVSSFWDYIETGAKEQRLRFMSHSVRRETKRKLEKVRVPNLEYMVLDACWERIRSYPDLKEALKNSELPFDLYRTEGKLNIPVRMNEVSWLVEGMELIRRALKNDQHPNFGRWSGGKSRKEIYAEYCERFVPNAKAKAKEPKQENHLLSKLRRNGPQLPQPKRKVLSNKDMVSQDIQNQNVSVKETLGSQEQALLEQAAPTFESNETPLKTTLKVEVPESVLETVLQNETTETPEAVVPVAETPQEA